jgi:hypothetical protein
VLVGGDRLQIARFLQGSQELEQFLRPLVDLSGGLKQHRIGDRHRHVRTGQREPHHRPVLGVQLQLVVVQPARRHDRVEPVAGHVRPGDLS